MIKLVTTYGNGSVDKQITNTVLLKKDAGVENEVINIYPEFEFETLEGFGGAITDSAAYVYSLMNEAQKKQFVETYFSPDKMKYGIVRIHMDSCDFSTETYEAAGDKNDSELQSFSFARTEKYIIPLLQDAQKAAGRRLEIMLSPWSPPAYMKTNSSRVLGGSLKSEYRKRWAQYLCRYISEFQKRGFVVKRMSLQNEPKAVQTWDSCVYTAQEEKEFLRDFMYPALQENGLEAIEIFIWDHNKERVYERTRDIIDIETDKMVTGVAFHWYSGDHFEALDLVRKQFPEKKLIVSESCIEYSKFGGDDEVKNALRLSHEIIGDLNNGMTAFYDWNLLLDEKGGPNHVGNYCHAPFLYDTEKKELKPQLLLQHFNHFSHYLVPGSVRIGYSRYTEQIDVTAYKCPNGQIIFILLNKSEISRQINIRIAGKQAEIKLYPESVMTGMIEG